MTDQKVIDTFEAAVKAIESLNGALDLHEEYLRKLNAQMGALSQRMEQMHNAHLADIREIRETFPDRFA